jgi:hypothetical protein
LAGKFINSPTVKNRSDTVQYENLPCNMTINHKNEFYNFIILYQTINVIKHITVESGYFYLNTVNTFIEKDTSQHQEHENEDIREINTSSM